MNHPSLISIAFRSFLIPTVISYMTGAINGVVDAAIVGNCIGEHGLSVVNMCIPINVLIITLMTVCFVGASIIASRSIAAGEHTVTTRVFTTAVILTLSLSIVVSVLGLLNLDAIASVLCHQPQLLPDVTDYARVMILSMPVMAMCGGIATMVKTDSSPRLVTSAVLIATAINMVLDYVFIRYCHTGVVGSAWAGAIGFAVSLCVCCTHFTFKRSHLRLARPLPPVQWREMLLLGLPMTIQQLCNATRAAAINNMVEDAFGSHGVALLMLFINFAVIGGVLFSGVNQVMQIINSSTIGSSDRRGFAIAQRQAVLYIGVGVSLICLIIMIVPQHVAALFGFTADADTAANIRQLAPTLLLMAVNYTLMSIYQITGRPNVAIVISLLQSLMALPVMMLLLHYAPRHFCLAFSGAEAGTLLVIFIMHRPLAPGWDVQSEHTFRLTPDHLPEDVPQYILDEARTIPHWTILEATVRQHRDGSTSTLIRHNGHPTPTYTRAINLYQRLLT